MKGSIYLSLSAIDLITAFMPPHNRIWLDVIFLGLSALLFYCALREWKFL